MYGHMQLILGSGSPRRQEILEKLGYQFKILTADVEESCDQSMGLEQLSIYNAQLKAEAVFASLPNQEQVVVLGSDTVVWLENQAYGKPKDRKDAIRMLTNLSGKTHQVGTGVALVTHAGLRTYCEISEVTFHTLNRNEIESYIDEVYVMDKAGAYAIQDEGQRIVQTYTGEYETIMGLPTIRLQEELQKIL